MIIEQNMHIGLHRPHIERIQSIERTQQRVTSVNVNQLIVLIIQFLYVNILLVHKIIERQIRKLLDEKRIKR